ncbi:MAG: metallophosphoesterase [Hyphomicrobiales bacterium]
MSRRKLIFWIGFIVVAIAGFFIIRQFSPVYASRYPLLVILVLLDIYLWNGIKSGINKSYKAFKSIVSFLYWLPIGLLIISGIITPFDSIPFWNKDVRVIFYGIILCIYAAKIIPMIFYLISDFIKLFYKKKKEKSIGGKQKRRAFLKTVGLAGGGVMLVTMVTGIFKWVHDFKVHQIFVPIKGLPKSFEGFKILQLSDIHLGSWINKDKMEEAIDIMMEQKPDLILFTGDLVNYKSSEALPFASIMKRIKAPYGVYCTLGNHDYGDYAVWPTKQAKQKNMQQLYDFYENIGWELLNNENRIIEKDGEQLALIGVENWSHFNRFPKKANIKKALDGTESINAKILMSHDPTHWHYVIRKEHPEIGLTLSGHTHGFQFGVETAKFKWSPSQYLYPEWAGLYSNKDHCHLYVNRGLGVIGYPGRVGIKPEISMIQLKTL